MYENAIGKLKKLNDDRLQFVTSLNILIMFLWRNTLKHEIWVYEVKTL